MTFKQAAERGGFASGRYITRDMAEAMGDDVAEGYKRGSIYARSWRTPPNWSAPDWKDELSSLALMSAWQAKLDFDPSRGVPLTSFVFYRVKAQAFTLYRQEWRHALRFAASEMQFIESQAGAGLDPHSNGETCESLEWALGQLSEGDRWLIEQIFWKHRTEIALAEELKISQPAVNKRKRMALQRLIALIKIFSGDRL